MLEDLPGDPWALVGREAELGQLASVVDAVATRGQVLIVLGDAGMGKSTLLGVTADRARRAGVRVLVATGRESEATLAFAGLHQLLSPVLATAADLPGRQEQALLGALGLAGAADPDRLLTAVATLTLLSDMTASGPVLAVIDDAHWLDRSSLEMLAFVGSRLDGERIALLLGARGQAPPAGFDRGFPEISLAPLPPADAAQLLGTQPSPLRGRAREQVLAHAAGNPMALIELARTIAADPGAGGRWAGEPLPPGQRLAALISARFTVLPAPARAALLLAAVADGPELTAMPGFPQLEPQSLADAEKLGLVTVDRTGVRFSHPLIRSAVYHSAPFTERAAAHRQLASELADQPDRQAWHLAAAAVWPDEQVASLLEATAADAQRRGGVAAAALAMERAAELSPASDDQARRLVSAASAAVTAGHTDWVRDLTERALAATADVELRLRARSTAGWALAYSGHRSEAFAALISVADQAADGHRDLAWEALADAATVSYQAGTLPTRLAVKRVLRRLEQDPPDDGRPRLSPQFQRAWILACADPHGSRGQLVPYLRQIAATPLDEAALWRAGSAAWLLDESALGLTLLREAMRRLRRPGQRGASGGGLTALGWLYVDTGRWELALQTASEAADLAEANQMRTVAKSADAITATVLALRGDVAAARAHAERALADADPAEDGLITARAWRALGLAAVAEGDHLLAFTQLRKLFSEEGIPAHHIFSYLGVSDIATAAVRADHRSAGRQLLERAVDALDGPASPRVALLLARARGILADPAEAGDHFAAALGDPAGENWPFERAQLRLDYGEWLRRQRRINEAKPHLVSALDNFRRLRARPWAERAEAELRAAGVSATGPESSASPLAVLTPQERQIVLLARDGLTNREIGDRLFLSSRTVSTHLYRTFPKLGITRRHQLRDVIPADEA